MSGNPQIFPPSVLKATLAELTAAELAVLAAISLGSASSDQERLSAFLNRVFSRAPTDVIRRKRAPELLCVTRGCLEVLALHRAQPKQLAITYNRAENWGGLFIALNDRPFIISSIAERLYEAEIALECYQHPILNIDGVNVALSYIEVAPRSHDLVEAIIPQIKDTLEALATVVSDHQEMLKATKSIAIQPSAALASEWGALSGDEVKLFLEWLTIGTFFFVGVSTWRDQQTPSARHGIWQCEGSYSAALQGELTKDLNSAESAGLTFSLHKLRITSCVHRRAPLINILIKPSRGEQGWISIVGYLTSKAWAHEAQDIPVLRAKLGQILASEETPIDSHDYKYVIEVIDNMPTDEALRMPVRDLRVIAQLALGVFSRDDSRSVTCLDAQRRWALTTVVMPPSRFSADVRQEIQGLVERFLGARDRSSETHLDSSKKRQLRLYISTPISNEQLNQPNLDELGRIIQRATLSWSELLEEQLRASSLEQPNQDAQLDFPESYQASTPIVEAIHDLELAKRCQKATPLAVSLCEPRNKQHAPNLSFISHQRSTSLSSAVPVLENVGLEVLDANSYSLRRNDEEIHILKCSVRPFDGEEINLESFNRSVAPALERIITGQALSDPLNLLLRKIPVTIKEIYLLRCYCAFLWQTYKIATKRTMWKALAYSPDVAREFIRYFETAFNPSLSLSANQRQDKCASIEQDYQIALRKVPDITHDRILKALMVLLKNTVRTNFYTDTETIALKVRAEKVEFLPHPRPLFEIFVFSSRVEGTHLRSSKVARGGIRWSERIDDYRSEVLGLMKTQKVKNVIIVPSGAKGGFIVKTPAPSPDQLPAIVQAAYREYISAMLTIADNTVNGETIHPANCVVRDEPDPYFVVAADKGTATFSDTANTIAQNDFKFWLGDAFASGGSQGYDHKKYGITARGGLECVARHAKDLGIDTTSPFTTVGIGDLSGDVFGNALIINPAMLLIAAFNHKHIFIDPNPEPHTSFAERVRLFNLPGSQWSDYDPKLISSGGGVFNRFDKEITLTPEIRAALGVGDDMPSSVDGETLIALILKAPVTLLWNGGIGTYVKARSESHSDVNDGANDTVRVNADELRCKIVGEGGNLGFTQRARVQCAQQGIRINTDAIDNSGGVDLSDHEVNLKLLFAPIVASGRVTTEQRNTILKDIANEVVELVLQHNRDQSLMLSVSEICSVQTLAQYRALLREMHSLGYLDRARDHLPDEQELDLRGAHQRGLTRPELALCGAAVKMWLKDGLRGSALLSDPDLERNLLAYFPTRVQSEFRDDALNHPLRREIITNEIVGEMTLAVGIAFLPTIVASQGSTVPTALKCLLAADSILQAAPLRARLSKLDSYQNAAAFTGMWLDMASALRAATGWLLQSHDAATPLRALVSLYRESFSALLPYAGEVFSGDELRRFNERVQEYRAAGASDEDAITLSLYRRILQVFEILWCAREYKRNVNDVARMHTLVLDTLQMAPIFKFEKTVQSSNAWERELAEGAYHDIRRSLSNLSGTLLNASDTSLATITGTLSKHKSYQAIRSIMSDVMEGARQKQPFAISALPLLARHLKALGEAIRA